MKKQVINNIIYFFPFQLLITYFKRNQFLILIWFVIFAFITNSLGTGFGIPGLFLTPEYLDRVDFFSFFIFGLSFGALMIAFNISGYIVNGYRFPFIVTLEHPFFKFTINNFIIPIVVVTVFILNSVSFQKQEELLSGLQIFYNISGFVLGLVSFVVFSFLYFFRTNKDVGKYFGIKKEKIKSKKIIKPLNKIIEKDKIWKQQMSPSDNKYGNWRVETYLTPKFKIKKSRDFSHYPKEMIIKVLHQNHFNSLLYGMFIILVIMFLVFFNDLHYFNFPAGFSFLLFLNLLLLIYSLFHLFFKEWSIVVAVLLLSILLLTPKENFLNYNNSAYGLKYYKKIIELKRYRNDIQSNLGNDKNNIINILNKWKLKNMDNDTSKLPKIVFVNTSGGGLKASLWTYKVLSYLDSATNGDFFNKTVLITGASGGMMGAAYYRELKYRLLTHKDTVFDDKQNFNNISKDILNPVAFSLFLKDWYFHFQKFEYKNNFYYKDRASMFDSKFNCNTNNILNNTLSYYKYPEQEAVIPMIILSPTIVNYGRKLYISPQGVSFLVDYKNKFSNIDFRRFYTYFNPDSLSFISALRMNATFPYISPIISLPGSPRLNIMDAAISDNYGLTTTLKFIFSFQDWIKENTSGVVLIQITEDGSQISDKNFTKLDELFMPLSSIYVNMFDNQELNNTTLINLTRQSINKNIDFVYFNLDEKENQVPLSWHLSSKEKKLIDKSAKTKMFKDMSDKLFEILYGKTNDNETDYVRHNYF